MSSPQTVPETEEGLIYVDGYICNEDGEVVGMTDAPDGHASKEPFIPTDLKGADWVLARMFDHEVETVAINARFDAAIRALTENRDAQLRPHTNGIRFLDYQYGPALEKIAREILDAAGNKSKTVTTDHGKISFHRGRPSVEILDDDAALAWAKEHAPDIVITTERVNKTDVDPLLADDVDWFRRNPAQETMRLSTGVRDK